MTLICLNKETWQTLENWDSSHPMFRSYGRIVGLAESCIFSLTESRRGFESGGWEVEGRAAGLHQLQGQQAQGDTSIPRKGRYTIRNNGSYKVHGYVHSNQIYQFKIAGF